jgi:hypothetical protein
MCSRFSERVPAAAAALSSSWDCQENRADLSPLAPSFISRVCPFLDRSPAEADFQRYFKVTAPSVHQMLKTLEKSGLIEKQPSVARSIQLRVLPQVLPILGLD